MNLIHFNMGVTEEKHTALGQGREVLGIVMMAMGQIQGKTIGEDHGAVSQAGEGQNHLIHLRLAVAPDSQDDLPVLRKHRDHRFGGIIPGQIVPGTVIEQIAQQEQSVRLL